jgi:uncharacterized membrane protein YphA (DoxX/SURF4 family)
MLSLMWVAGPGGGGGLLIILGLFTRPVAFLLCGQMAVAYFKAHYPRGFWPSRTAANLPWSTALSSFTSYSRAPVR